MHISSSSSYSNAPTINIASYSNGSQNSTNLWGVDSSTRNLKFQSGTQPSNQIYHKSFASDFDFGEWHYYTFTANQGKLYGFVDGELYTECTTSMWASTYFTIGQLNTTNDYDELFVCHEALYLQDFTPPTKPWDYTSTSTNEPFYSSIAPTSWSGGDSSANNEWQGTNSYGEWKCSCSVETTTSDTANLGFNGNTNDCATTNATNVNPDWIIAFPNNILISPTKITITYNNSSYDDTKLYGFNEDTQSWEQFASYGNNTTSKTTYTLNTSTPNFYSKIKLHAKRNSNSQCKLYELVINEGTIKYLTP